VCVDQEGTGFAEACLDRGVHYVDITASYAFLSQVERLDALAKRSGATGVLSVGLAPGLTNLLAKHAKDVLGAVRNLEIYVMLGLGEAHGKAAVRWTVENLDKRFAIRRSGASKIVGSFEGPKQTIFPGKYGRRTAYFFDFADQHAVARTQELENVATRLCFDSAAVTWMVAALKRTRLFRMLARLGVQDALAMLFARFPMGSDEFVVKVDAEGESHGSRRSYSCSTSGRREGYATGLVAALVAELLYTSDVERGVFHIEQLFDPLAIFGDLADYALTIELGSAHVV
jgi:saccharopine dehydrogenase-like NADP-dependent oxidoreductase